VALLALRFDDAERVSGKRLGGLLLGLTGVVVLVGIEFAGHGDELLGALAILFPAFCLRRWPDAAQAPSGRP
jgi:drug/metabolite transporter (DMT)-like permease